MFFIIFFQLSLDIIFITNDIRIIFNNSFINIKSIKEMRSLNIYEDKPLEFNN